MEIYMKYSSYCGKNNLPNIFQWLYLEEISSEKRNLVFNNTIFRQLSECQDQDIFEYYIKYSELKEILGKYNLYKKVPRQKDVISAVHKMESIIKYIDNMDFLNCKIKDRNEKYIFEDNEFIVVTPKTVIEIIDEAVFQDNCLLEYIDKIAVGETNISFIRKKSNKCAPFVTLEIIDHCIIQARTRFNELPEVRVYKFLEKFARETWLGYDPYFIITCDSDFEIIGDREDLKSYLVDFQRRNEWPKFPDDGVTGEQLCLWDYFPECFS